jgi:Sulfotransferase family
VQPRRETADFQNFYGQTARLHGPNDGFALWNHWLGEDRYVPRTDLSDAERESMRQFFLAWSAIHGKPFLNKNNRNTGCLDLLAQVLPQARFVVVRRNPLLVAQSLIRAREQVQGDKSVGWGLHSQSSDTTADPLKYVEDVGAQILQIEKQLDDQVTYEGFCEAPAAAIREICQTWPGLPVRDELMERELRPFEASGRITLTDMERERLLKCLQSGRPVMRFASAAVAAG